MVPELGPLEYVMGSHLWGDGRSGTASHFFDPDQRALLRSAAEREGVDPAAIDDLIVSMAHMRAGGASLHDAQP